MKSSFEIFSASTCVVAVTVAVRGTSPKMPISPMISLAPLVLMTSANVVLSTAIWMTWDFPDLPGAAAIATMLVAGLLVLVLPVQLIAARDAARRD